MRTNGEIEKFEKALNEISKVVKEEDIPGLCKVFNDILGFWHKIFPK